MPTIDYPFTFHRIIQKRRKLHGKPGASRKRNYTKFLILPTSARWFFISFSFCMPMMSMISPAVRASENFFTGLPLRSEGIIRSRIQPRSIRCLTAMLTSGWRMSAPRSISREVASFIFIRYTSIFATLFRVPNSMRWLTNYSSFFPNNWIVCFNPVHSINDLPDPKGRRQEKNPTGFFRLF